MKKEDLIKLIIECVKTAEDPTYGTINYTVLTEFLKNELP